LRFEDHAHEIVEKIERDVRPIDILVNCAGAAKRTPAAELTPAQWRAAMEAKYFSYGNVIDPVIKRMAARRTGVIVNVIGSGGKVAAPTHIAGGAANAALMLATVGLANAYARHGLCVVGINPGRTKTDRVAEGMKAEARLAGVSVQEALADALKRIRLGRMATPDEIAQFAVFLSSSRASYITGVIVNMDGGQSSTVV
jgi:NAD(P)-dependent dehydrogenase (short-subunit alcohol dehydrogenase family)